MLASTKTPNLGEGRTLFPVFTFGVFTGNYCTIIAREDCCTTVCLFAREKTGSRSLRSPNGLFACKSPFGKRDRQTRKDSMAEGADVHMSENEDFKDSCVVLQAKRPVPVAITPEALLPCAKVPYGPHWLVDEPMPTVFAAIVVQQLPQRPENSTLGVITESREALQGPITEPEPKNSTEAKRPEVSHNGGVNFESLEDALDDLEHDGALEDWHYYWLMQQGELP